MSNADDPQAWIVKARADLLCIANNIAAAQVPWDIVAFHAQQAAEKALKAFLVSRGETVVKTHDLTFLLNQCLAVGAHWDEFDEPCRWLTRYAAHSRYPGMEPELDAAEGQSAVAAARRIVDAVAAMLN
jgi:HEPN domain-containing protein